MMTGVFGDPDFARLPEGTEEEFGRRIARLPVHRVESRIDADAVIHNETVFLDGFCAEHGVVGDRGAALRTWHFRAVIDRLSLARPDLVPPRSTIGSVMIHHHRLSLGERIRHRWRRWCPNVLMGWPTWCKNRWSGVRSVWVRRRAAELRRAGDQD